MSTPARGGAFNVDDGTPRRRVDLRFEMHRHARQDDASARWWNAIADGVDPRAPSDAGTAFLPPDERA